MKKSLTDPVAIVTANPELFNRYFFSKKNVHVFDAAASFYKFNATQRVQKVFVDWRAVSDGVSGRQLAMTLQSQSADKDANTPGVYIMVEAFNSTRDQWLVSKFGVTEVITRSPSEIAKIVFNEAPKISDKLASTMLDVDSVFRKYGGIMREFSISEAREKVELGTLQASGAHYISHLASLIKDELTKQTFLKEVEAVKQTNASFTLTFVGDPWIDQVNGVLSRIAGGITAHLSIPNAMKALVLSDEQSRDSYVHSLCDNLSPTMQGAFITALSERGLINVDVFNKHTGR